MKAVKRGRSYAMRFLAALFAVLCMGVICFTGGTKAEGSETLKSAADAVTPQFRLGNVTVYEAKQNRSMITVPVYAQGGIDLRAYDFVISYDTDMLAYCGTDIMEEWNDCSSELEEELGVVHFAGATLNENAKCVNGQIGTLTFLLKKSVRADDIRTGIALHVNAFGEDTEVNEIFARGGLIVLNKSAAPETPVYTFIYGDVNKDGEANASDALFVLKHVVRLPMDVQTEFDASDLLSQTLADMDGDGKITASDALHILRTVVELTEERVYDGALADPAEFLTDAEYAEDVPLRQQENWDRPKTLDKGDMDGDGAYSVHDAFLVLQEENYLCVTAQPEASDSETDIVPTDGADHVQEFDRADINGDGELTREDAQLLTDAAVGLYTNFGYEQPQEARVIYVDSKSYTRGDYCFRTLTEAVGYLNSNPPACEEERITVRLAPGTYREYTALKAPYVTYEAMDAEAEQWPNITFYYGCGNYYASFEDGMETMDSSGASTTITSAAHDFCARHIMFENSYNIYMTKEEYSDFTDDNNLTLEVKKANIRVSKYQTQALALRVDADRCTFYDCRIIGRQDTLLMHNSNRVYFEECYVEGTVDFIYGSATAVFERCTINSPYHAGHITAASTPDAQPYGFLFNECELTMVPTTESDAPKAESYSLGRPWNGSAMVTYSRCRMDKHISNRNTPDFDRFITMNEKYPKEASRYAEYQTMDMDGNLIDLESAAPDYEKILTDEDMEGFYAPVHWLEARYNSKTQEMEYDGWNPGNYE